MTELSLYILHVMVFGSGWWLFVAGVMFQVNTKPLKYDKIFSVEGYLAFRSWMAIYLITALMLGVGFTVVISTVLNVTGVK